MESLPIPGQGKISLLLLINYWPEVKDIPNWPLFFFFHELHGLTAAYQLALTSHQHLYLVPADFTDIDLADLVGHFFLLLILILMGPRFPQIHAEKDSFKNPENLRSSASNKFIISPDRGFLL